MDGKLTQTKPVNLIIDGPRLRQLREESGLTVSALARMAALSKNQIEQLENGGDSLFYNQGVKRQAARKLASLLGVDAKTVLTDAHAQAMPLDETPPQSAAHEEQAVGGAVVHSANETPDAHPLTLSEHALSAQSDQAPHSAETVHVKLAAEKDSHHVAAVVGKGGSKAWLWVIPGTLACAAGLAWQQGHLLQPYGMQLQGLAETWFGIKFTHDAPPPVQTSTPATTAPSAAPAADSTDAQAPGAASTLADAKPLVSSNAADPVSTPMAPSVQPACPERLGDLPATYAPQATKLGNRVHIISNQAVAVCVQDATGQQWTQDIKPHVPQTFSGKAPWWIGSHELNKVQIFYQGWRVFDNKADAKQIYLRERVVSPAN